VSADDHGRISTYTNHKCRCLRCTEAWRLYHLGQRAERQQKTEQNGGVAPVWQHNRSTYYNWACRCEACRTDAAARQRSRRATA
jgi:hypothetical protein